MPASRSLGRPIVLVAILFGALLGPPVAVADDDDDLVDAPVAADYDPLPPDRAWREAIRLPAVPAEHDGGGVTVAVLDTGITRLGDLGDRVVARVTSLPTVTATTVTGTAPT